MDPRIRYNRTREYKLLGKFWRGTKHSTKDLQLWHLHAVDRPTMHQTEVFANQFYDD